MVNVLIFHKNASVQMLGCISSSVKVTVRNILNTVVKKVGVMGV